MQTDQLLDIIMTALEDLKAHDIQILDVKKLTTITDVMIIASGHSQRQVNAITQHIIEQAKKHGYQPLGEQGRDVGEWALVDLGEVVIHVMQPQIREFYQLEKLWHSANNAPSRQLA